ncbi:MAG: dihydrolipoyl dehydrogenase [Desulfopila sp.]
MGDMEMTVDLAIIGSGPGGYSAAFRGADLGMDVAMIDPRPFPGGACLHEGCIPSKTYLFLAELIFDSRRAERMGLSFPPPKIDLAAMSRFNIGVIDDLSRGLVRLCAKRSIQRIQGHARFENATTLRLENSEISRLRSRHAVIATGSVPISFPGTAPTEKNHIISSAQALQLTDIPERILVIGGGYVGLELGTVYSALGSEVHLAERQPRLLPAVDIDLVAPLNRRLQRLFAAIHLDTAIDSVKENGQGVTVRFSGPDGQHHGEFDRVLVAMGRRPVTQDLGLENTRVQLDARGCILVDEQQRTAEPNIFAAGDVVGSAMQAHTATREGRIAAEVIAGKPSSFDPQAIPTVVYTDPQIAWCGVTEQQATARNIPIVVRKFPWKYSGRANTMGATDGLTKIIADPASGRILGLGISGRNAEAMISEGVLAIEMGALVEDMALSLHPHPTLAETESEAAELFLGSPIYVLPGQKT